MFETKKQAMIKIKEKSSLTAAAVLGIGVGLIITIIFTKIGVWFVLAGLIIAVAGTGISKLVPNFFKYQPITCPFCREESQVKLNVVDYTCDNCDRKLSTINKKGIIRRKHLKLVVDNSLNSFGKPSADDTINTGQRQKGNS